MQTDRTETEAPQEPPAYPSFPARVVQVVISPGRVFDALREKPRSLAALVLGAVLVVLSTALIPGDVWSEMARTQALEAGRELPADFDMSGLFRISAILGGAVFWFVWAYLLAGLTTLLFAFVLGDDGRFKQYLAVTAHAMLVPAFGALLTTPLKILQRDPQLTLNLGVFLPPGAEGYWVNVLTMLDFFMIWSYVLLALGVHVIDRRREWSTATMLLLGFALVLALGMGALIPR